MSYIPEISQIVSHVQFLCGERIFSPQAKVLNYDAEIMLCSTPENYSKLLGLFGKLDEETDDFVINISKDIATDIVFLYLSLSEYNTFIEFPDLYEIVFCDFEYDELQFSEFEYHIRRHEASIAITIGQINNNSVYCLNEEETITISGYKYDI